LENELLRRWSIRIWNIKITNLISSSYDPFVQFVIGGDFREVIKYDKENNPYKQELGERGLIFRTDVLMDAERDQVRTFESSLICDFDATYIMIEDEKVDIEVT
jgi:centrosomal protein CEP76